MAVDNNLQSVIPTLYAQGLESLRSMCVMPRLVLNDFSEEVREKGDTIQIPMPSAMTTTPIIPAAFAPDPQNIAPTTAQISLDSWEEAAFTLTEKEYAQVVNGIVPIQLSAAVQTLAASVNASIFANYVYVGNAVGVAGTTPFATGIKQATDAGVYLDNNYALQRDRAIVLDPTGYGQAEQLPNFAYYMYSGDKNTVNSGIIRDKFGFDWHKDQQVPYQIAGTLTGAVTASKTQPMGGSVINVVTGSASSFAPHAGDIITFSGDAQTYTVLSGGVVASPLEASATGTLNIYPAKLVPLVGGETMTLMASHRVNLAFQRQAFGFASRPVKSGFGLRGEGRGVVVAEMMVPDPVSGLVMHMEIREEYRRTRVAYSMLWGTAPVRPNVACRIMG